MRDDDPFGVDEGIGYLAACAFFVSGALEKEGVRFSGIIFGSSKGVGWAISLKVRVGADGEAGSKDVTDKKLLK